MAIKYQQSFIKATKAAAKFLTEHPEKFNFNTINIPTSMEDCGCYIGWIGFFITNSKFAPESNGIHNVHNFFNFNAVQFYDALRIYIVGSEYGSLTADKIPGETLKKFLEMKLYKKL